MTYRTRLPRSFARSAVVASVALVAIATTLAAAQSARPSTIPVSEIRRGMRGYGLTVFQGTQPERFDVEVIDVLHNFRPDQDLILIRTPHPILDHAATVGGMSGSPIYFDDRLAGAYAYGWPFGKDPIAGVTPIANMFAEMRRAVRPGSFPGAPAFLPRPAASASAAPAPRSRLAGLPPWDGQGRVGALDRIRAYAATATRGSGAASGITRVATPVLFGGLTDAAARVLDEALTPFGLVPLQAGGGATRRTAGAPAPAFVDGGAIGVQLIRGDVSATAIGTVTHVDGRRLVAFGHPMMDAGEIGLPTCTARVLHILASEARSFKLAEADTPFGTLVQDRQATIVVDTTANGQVVPVRIRVRGIPGAPRTEWNVEVPSHRLLTPMLTGAAALNALGATASDVDHVMFTATSRVTVEGHGTHEVVDYGSSSSGIAEGRAIGSARAFDLIEAAYGNPFEDARVSRVEIDLDVEFRRDWDRILDVSVSDERVDPGSRVNLRVVLRRFGQADRTLVVPIDIPETAAGKTIEVRLEPGDLANIEQPIARDLDDIIEIIKDRRPGTALMVSLAMPTRGLRFEGHTVSDLPGSALDALSMANDTSAGAPFATYRRQEIDMDNLLVGSARISLEVRAQRRAPR